MNSVVRLVAGLAICLSASLAHAQQSWNPLNAFKKQPASNVGWPGPGAGQQQTIQPVSFIQKWNQGLEKTKQALTLPSLQMPQIQMPQITAPQIQMPQITPPQIQMPGMQNAGAPRNQPFALPKLQMPKLQMPKLQMPQLLPPRNPGSGGGISSIIPKWLKPQAAQPRMNQPPTLNQFLSQQRP